MKTPRDKALLVSRWTAARHAMFCLGIMILGAFTSLATLVAQMLHAPVSMPSYIPTTAASMLVFFAWMIRGFAVRRWAGVSDRELSHLQSYFRGDAAIGDVLDDSAQASLLRVCMENGFVSWAQLAAHARAGGLEWMFVGKGGEGLATPEQWRHVCSEGAQLDASCQQVSHSTPLRRL